MNKDIKTLIYGNLSLEEKLKIADIDDPVLDREIVKEIRETWQYHIVDYVWRPVKPKNLHNACRKVRGRDREEALWQIFIKDNNYLTEISIQDGSHFLKHHFKLDEDIANIQKRKEKILSINSKEKIIRILEETRVWIYMWKLI